jgi:hypothetical protein
MSTEKLEPVDAALASEPVQRLAEADADAVGRQVAEVLDHEEQQAALELHVEDHVRLARPGTVLGNGSGHVVSVIRSFRGTSRL